MAISPMDIHHKEFGTVRMGGYNKEEVDSFLDMVADELDRLLHRNQEQSEMVEAMRQKAGQFDSMQQTLQNALINAQKSADNIVQEAKAQAEAQIKEAQDNSLHILEEAQAEKARISQSFESVRDQVRRYIGTIRELLDNNQSMIKDYEARLAAEELREQPAAPAPAPSPASAPAPPVPEPPVTVEPQAVPEAIPEFMQQATLDEIPPRAAEPAPAPREPAGMHFQTEEVSYPQDPPKPAYEMPQEPPAVEQELKPLTSQFDILDTPTASREPAAPPPVQKYSPEEEMEMMRETLTRESPAPAPPAPPAQQQPPEPLREPVPEPAPEPIETPESESEEKHFFWE